MSFPQPSIQTSLLLTLILLSSLAIASSLISLGAFNRIAIDQNKLMSQSLPAMRTANQLTNAGLDLLDIGNSLNRTITTLELKNIKRDAELLFDDVETHAKLLKNNNTEPLSAIEPLEDRIQKLISNIQDQILLQDEIIRVESKLISERDLLTSILDESDIAIKLLESEISLNIIEDNPTQEISPASLSPLIEFRFIIQNMNRIVNHSRLAASLLEIEEEKNLYRLEVKKMISIFLKISKDNRATLVESANLINDSFIKDDNLFAVWSLKSKKTLQLNNIQINNIDLNQRLSDFYTNISKKSNTEIDNKASQILASLDASKLVLIIVATLAFFSSILFYLFFIRPKISNRLLKLSKATQLIANDQYDTQIDTVGTDEISIMARSLDYFRNQLIEKNIAELEREKLIEKLSHSNTDLERFAYSCSHDLQEPIRMILSFSELLQKKSLDKLDPKSLEYLGYINQGAENARALVQDMLDYSRLDQTSVEKQWVSIDAICKQANLITVVIQQEKKGKFTWENGEKEIYGITPQLVQLITNLVSNGLKYNNNDTPQVKLTASETETDYILCVADNGIGIDSRYHNKIFDIFKRLVNRREYSGSGIGLSICKKITENHGGKIWVESTIDTGSKFYFSLPKQ